MKQSCVVILILDKIAKGYFIVPLTWHTAYSGKKKYLLRFLRRKPQAAILQPDKTALAVLSKTRIKKYYQNTLKYEMLLKRSGNYHIDPGFPSLC